MLFRSFLPLFPLCALAACTIFSPPAKHISHAVKAQRVDALSFVEHLSLAHAVILGDGTVAEDDAKGMETYTRQKKEEATAMVIVVLSYKDGEHVSAPVAGHLASLADVLAAANSISRRLKEVEVRGVTIAPGIPMKLVGKEESAVNEQVETRHRAMLDSAHKLPPAQEARLQLKLLKFFTDEGQRDAAYLSADNAKHLISELGGAHKQDTVVLSKELEQAEGELREKMPY